MERPKLKLTFNEPRNGYWDGGKRYGGEFTPELLVPFADGLGKLYPDEHPGKNHTIRWGCFSLNYWFNSGSGRTWKEAASIAKRRLIHLCSGSATIEVIL